MVFSRVRNDDKVVIGINLPKEKKEINVTSIFKEGEELKDFYSDQIVKVNNGNVIFNSKFDIVLLEKN